MKKIYLTLAITCFSVMSFSQPETELNSVPNDSIIKKAEPQDRITKLENEVKELKASNQQLQKQLADIKQQLPVLKKKKLVVSRTSSKQGVWVDE